MKFNLNRFITAQEKDFSKALNEVQNGKKISHWMWYIFPQIKGLGQSYYSDYYGIDSIEEAKEYWKNKYLKNNLIQIVNALLNLSINDPTEIFGFPDDMKLKSCMTLFLYATNDLLFDKVLTKFFYGSKDDRTIEIIKKKF